MVEEGLILSRFVHYASLLFVFGSALFPLYAFSGEEPQAYPGVTQARKGWVSTACLLALASGVAWLVFASASMGGALSEAMKSEMMGTVLHCTVFGKVWSVHLALVTGLAIFAALNRGYRSLAHVLLSAACLASLAGVGHTQTQDGIEFLVHATSDGAHLLAAGAWLGGLVPLLAILRRSEAGDDSKIYVSRILTRFSGLGYLAVGVLIATGAINSWYLIGSVRQMPASLYGQLLIAKLGLFTLMLLLAATNRFWLVPALQASNGSKQREASVSRLRSHIVGEQLFGLLIIAIVSLLGMLAPRAG